MKTHSGIFFSHSRLSAICGDKDFGEENHQILICQYLQKFCRYYAKTLLSRMQERNFDTLIIDIDGNTRNIYQTYISLTMDILNRIIFEIKKTDSIVMLYWIMSLLFVIPGWGLLISNPPNFQVGFPMAAIGFAFFVFGTNKHNSLKAEKKFDSISEKIDAIHEQLKKRE